MVIKVRDRLHGPYRTNYPFGRFGRLVEWPLEDILNALIVFAVPHFLYKNKKLEAELVPSVWHSNKVRSGEQIILLVDLVDW